MTGTFALDIEVCPTTSEPSFTATEDWALVAIAAGYRAAPTAEVEATVFFPDDTTADAYAETLWELVSWYQRRGHGPTLTYNGGRFDKPHLLAWGRESGDPVLHELLHDVVTPNVDLIHAATHRFSSSDSFLSLDAACDAAGIDVAETRFAEYDGVGETPVAETEAEVMSGQMLAGDLGEWYLARLEQVSAGAFDGAMTCVREMIRDYAVSDVEPLFALADELGVVADARAVVRG